MPYSDLSSSEPVSSSCSTVRSFRKQTRTQRTCPWTFAYWNMGNFSWQWKNLRFVAVAFALEYLFRSLNVPQALKFDWIRITREENEHHWSVDSHLQSERGIRSLSSSIEISEINTGFFAYLSIPSIIGSQYVTRRAVDSLFHWYRTSYKHSGETST